MDTIVTPVTVITLDSTRIVHSIKADLVARYFPPVVRLVQYDQSLPVIAVSLMQNGQTYTLPSGAAANIRVHKPDATYVYNPALGCDSTRNIVYFEVTQAMAAANGDGLAIVEIVVDGDIAGSSLITLHFEDNPVPEDAIESSDEWETIYELGERIIASTVTPVSTAAGMTDHNVVYLYTGTESGWNQGHMYYYNGTTWVDAGIAVTDKTLTVEGLAADAKKTGEEIADLKDGLDYIGVEKSLCHTSGNASDYDSGVDGLTYAYLLNDGGEPLVIPKGGKIKKFRCVTPSTATQAINIFFMKRVLNGYTLVSKLENVDISGSKYIDLSDLEFSTQCYIAVSNATNYALRFKTTPVSGATEIRNLVCPVADIGETKTAVFTQASQRFYAFDIDILKPTEPITYEVGVGKDFTYFTAMLRALKNDTDEKIVYVDGGTYDIYAEKGGANYLSSITNPSSLNWRDVCEVVPDNTKIIGRGKVVLKWNPPASAVGSNEKAYLFSPLNVSGSCHIENIEIECTNCRYAIHDETSSLEKWNYVERTYKNVKAKKTHGTYGNDQLYAAGIAPNGTYLFEDCHFESDRNWMFSMHTTAMEESDKVTVNLKECTLVRTGTSGYQNTDMVGFGNTHTAKRYVDVKFDNCWLNGNIMLYAEGNMANAVNAYAVRTVGCNAVSINVNGVTNEQPIMQKEDLLSAYVTDTASGSIASFPDGADNLAVKSLTVNIEPVQSGSGDPSPDNVRPISGHTQAVVTRTGKNLIAPYVYTTTNSGVQFAYKANGDIVLNGNSTGETSVPTSGEVTVRTLLKAGTYTPSVYGDNVGIQIIAYNPIERISEGGTFTLAHDREVFARLNISANQTYNNAIFHMQVEEGTTATAYEPYQGQTVTISLNGTRYGGTLNVGTGVLTVDRVFIASYNGETLPSTWISDRDVYAAGTTPTTGAQVCYKVATPQTIQLTANEVKTLLGQNNIWSDAGTVDVEYRADTKLYIEKLTAPTEDDMIADHAISANSFFMVGNTLYRATTAIASGATITVGTNATKLSLSDALNTLS